MKFTQTTLRILMLAGMLSLAPSTHLAYSAEEDELAKEEHTLSEDAKRPEFEATLKERYALSDDQLKALHDKGMNDSQITIAAQLAKSSGKTLDEVVKMRLDDKMGWGKIAKELGVKPGEIGHAVADMHRNHKNDDAREKRAEARDEKRKEAKERRAERQEQREAKKAEHEHGHGKQ